MAAEEDDEDIWDSWEDMADSGVMNLLTLFLFNRNSRLWLFFEIWSLLDVGNFKFLFLLGFQKGDNNGNRRNLDSIITSSSFGWWMKLVTNKQEFYFDFMWEWWTALCHA